MPREQRDAIGPCRHCIPPVLYDDVLCIIAWHHAFADGKWDMGIR